MKNRIFGIALILFTLFSAPNNASSQNWQSKLISIDNNGQLIYHKHNNGAVIPDFSHVGYESGKAVIPEIKVVESIEPIAGDNLENIQKAINKVCKKKLNKQGYRGALLLKKGIYHVNGTIVVPASGVVIKGEGNSLDKTVIIETATNKQDLVVYKGKGRLSVNHKNKQRIKDKLVPAGRKYVTLAHAEEYAVGEQIVIYRPGTNKWIHTIKMDQIEEKPDLRQWKSPEYDLYFERFITKIKNDTIWFKNPIVMEMDAKFGGGYIAKCSFPGRINHCGIENILLQSTYTSDTDEDHGWNAIKFQATEHSWVRNITAQYFGYSAVSIGGSSKNITVINSSCIDPKSIITGGRRYSFTCNGQLNLVKNCFASDGRHDFVTGAQVAGPNVFTQCTARNTHGDTGPHHRWATGTLFDMIDTDGEINVQDRGNWGTGHGWAGVTQILWNCKVKGATVQSPWTSGVNYSIGTQGEKLRGRLKGRPNGFWEGQNKAGLTPASLYEAQLKNSK